MKLLVAGASEVDAGKTTFTVGLVGRTGVRGFKPRAGNDYWYDHDDFRRAVEERRLYGKDAKRLAAAAPGDVDPESINPVHRLWTPTPGRGKGVLGRPGNRFLIDRVTPPVGTGDGDHAADRRTDHYVVNADVEVPPVLRRRFPLEGARTVDGLPELNAVMADLHGPALSALGQQIDRRDAAVVESYADVATPLTGFEPDAVAVVEPRRCRIYDGRRYAQACEVAGGSARDGRLERRVGNVVELLDPVATAELPALSGSEGDDPGAVADAYGDVYDELLAAV